MELNNIIKIFVAPCKHITGIFRISEMEAKINDDIPFKEIENIKRPASLTISDKIEDGNRIYQSKLVFYTCNKWLADITKNGFICETIDGTRYLIGDMERPFPVVTQQQTHPNNYSDNQLTEVVVNFTSSKIPPIIR